MSERILSRFYEQLLRVKGASETNEIGLRVWHGGDITRRFLIHQNNRLSGLIEHLSETFPVVKALVGDDFFNGMSIEYIDQLRLDPPILNIMGASFAAFIEQFEHAKDLPYLADVARIEFARVRAFHAADQAALSSEGLMEKISAISHLERELDLSALKISLHSSLSVIQSAFAISSIWAAHQLDEAEQALALEQIEWSQSESCFVFRQGWQPIVMKVSWIDAFVTSKIMQGKSLQSVLLEIEQGDSEHLERFDLIQWLSMLMQNELIADFQVN
jgi:hypothetical protein